MVLLALRILRRFTATMAFLFAANTAFAGQKQAQDPAVACVRCHSSQTQTQPLTAMGHALQLSGANAILNSHPRLTFQKFGYTYVVETKDGQSTNSVTDGSQTIDLPVH
jgi:cytochrome c553